MNPCDGNSARSFSICSVQIDFRTCFVLLYMSYWMLVPQFVFFHTLTMASSFEDFNEKWRTVWYCWNLTEGS